MRAREEVVNISSSISLYAIGSDLAWHWRKHTWRYTGGIADVRQDATGGSNGACTCLLRMLCIVLHSWLCRARFINCLAMLRKDKRKSGLRVPIPNRHYADLMHYGQAVLVCFSLSSGTQSVYSCNFTVCVADIWNCSYNLFQAYFQHTPVTNFIMPRCSFSSIFILSLWLQ
jgi:hypothetical protein